MVEWQREQREKFFTHIAVFAQRNKNKYKSFEFFFSRFPEQDKWVCDVFFCEIWKCFFAEAVDKTSSSPGAKSCRFLPSALLES